MKQFLGMQEVERKIRHIKLLEQEEQVMQKQLLCITIPIK